MNVCFVCVFGLGLEEMDSLASLSGLMKCVTSSCGYAQLGDCLEVFQ